MRHESLYNRKRFTMNDTLEHFGIKGMKWGKRRAAARMAKKAKKKAEKQSRKTVDEWDTKYKKRSDMTDDEIAAATKRIRLENEFAEQLSRSSKYTGVKKNGFGESVKNVANATNNLNKSQKQLAGIATATASGVGLAYRYKDKIPDLAKTVYRTAKKAKVGKAARSAATYQKLLPPPSNW